jgi:hypothetical protein
VELGEGKQTHLVAVEENVLTFLETREDNSYLRCSNKIASTLVFTVLIVLCQATITVTVDYAFSRG